MILWNQMLAILLGKWKKKECVKLFCWEGRTSGMGSLKNVGDRVCGKNQNIFNNKVAQGNILYEMKSCLENAGKFYRGEKAMRRREEMVVTCCRNSAWSSKSHFKEGNSRGSAPIYLFLALHFSQERKIFPILLLWGAGRSGRVLWNNLCI